jgi:hypothetical protein
MLHRWIVLWENHGGSDGSIRIYPSRESALPEQHLQRHHVYFAYVFLAAKKVKLTL